MHTHCSVKPFTSCKILICLTMVLLPDSPAPWRLETTRITQLIQTKINHLQTPTTQPYTTRNCYQVEEGDESHDMQFYRPSTAFRSFCWYLSVSSHLRCYCCRNTPSHRSATPERGKRPRRTTK